MAETFMDPATIRAYQDRKNGQADGTLHYRVAPAVVIGTAANLQRKTFAPLRYVVPGYIAEGCTLLAGRPKLGKSWMMLEIALAVAMGDHCLGEIKADPGGVLYLALEDNERRLQSRITKLLGAFCKEWPERLYYATQWPRAHEGGLYEIRRWIDRTNSPRLAVVDVLARFRSSRSDKQSQYDADYEAIQALQQIASETGIAIVIVHHVRKTGAETDPFEKVSGTMGPSGGADTVLVLDRDGKGCTLYGRGRDIEEIESAVEFDQDACRWKVLGEASEVLRSKERKVILDVLREAGKPLSPRDVADTTGRSYEAVRKTLQRMAKNRDIEKEGRGCYRPCPDGPNVPTDRTKEHKYWETEDNELGHPEDPPCPKRR